MNNESQSWSPCPTGELTQMVTRSNRQRRLQKITQWSAIAALLLVGLFVAGVAVQQAMKYQLGPLSCGEVIAVMEDYHNGQLDAQTTQEVAQHLDHCRSCAGKYDQMYAAEARYNAATMEVAFAFR